jgi:hypothetical protein
MCQLKNVICLATLLLLSAGASAQQDYIKTLAGGGPNNVPATAANVPDPIAAATDNAGNYYFTTYAAQEYRVFKVSASGTLTVFAGTGFPGYSGDGGPASQAELDEPWGVAADSSGNVYIADLENCVIRKVDGTGTISTFAGTPDSCGYGGDGGPATSALLSAPVGVAVDKSGNVYIADTDNFRIREVTVSNGEIKTVAGTGTECNGGGACGDGGAATSAGVSYVYSLAVDGSGNVYIADSANYEIREFSVGGNINTVAGNGTYGYSGDGGLATNAELSWPCGVAVDSSGNIFIADYNNYRIREVTVSNGKINTVAGNGTFCDSGGAACGDGGLATSAELSYVYGVAVDSSDDIFIADYYNDAIREVTASNGKINTVAGNGTFGFTGNGIPATNAVLNWPVAATADSAGNIYIADFNNCIVREVSATTGDITTLAGTPGACGYGGDGGAATSAKLSNAMKVAVYAGNVYIADTDNCVIREVNTSGDISTFAGTPGSCSYGGDGGAATSAQLSNPTGVAVDSSGNVYIADYGNNRIREVSGGIINTVAGAGTGCAGETDTLGDGCPAINAELAAPADVALNASGNLYIADTFNQRIRIVNTSGIISTFAGDGSTGYSGDGVPATATSLYDPWGVAVDSAGDVLIADTYNNRIRWVDGAGIIHTVAGDGSYAFSGDGGLGTSAALYYPYGVGVDPSGNIYIADTYNGRVRMVNAVAGLNALPPSLTFGYQQVGTASSPQTVTLSPYGIPPVTIDSIVVTGDFSEWSDCGAGPLSGQCLMPIVFQPTAAGVRTGTVTINNSAFFGGSLVINLTGHGSGVLLTPNSLTFAGQDLGTTSAAKTVKLTNESATGLSMGKLETISAFVVSSNGCTGTIAAGASCTIGVEFAPTQSGLVTASLAIYDSDPSSPQLVLLQGTGIGASLSPTSLTFAARDAGTTSAAKSVTLTNHLSSSLSISSASIGGTNASDFAIVPTSTCGSSLAGNSKCTYNITFTPSVNGAESATLSISDAAGTQTATLSGTGVGAALSPTTLTFAAQGVGTTSAAKTVTLTNYLSSSLSISSATISGTNAADFATVPASTCTSSLAGNSKCTYNITFTPSVNGAESATLSVVDADGTQTATLNGTGAGAALSPTTLTFAAQDGGTVSAAKSVTLTNYLSSSLSISSATIGGTNASDFAILPASTCTSSLAGDSKCTYNITFTPSINGAESATLSVSDADGTQTATLKGTGIGAALSPTTLTFAAQGVGTTSAAKIVALTNYLSSSLSISSATISGTNAADFAIVSASTCTSSLAGNSSCTYNITFTPSVTGAETAKLSVVDADGTQTATLKGTGE